MNLQIDGFQLVLNFKHVALLQGNMVSQELRLYGHFAYWNKNKIMKKKKKKASLLCDLTVGM